MQASVPGLIDVSQEPKSILDLYGPDCLKAGTFAWSDAVVHTIENVGRTEGHVLRIELKQ